MKEVWNSEGRSGSAVLIDMSTSFDIIGCLHRVGELFIKELVFV